MRARRRFPGRWPIAVPAVACLAAASAGAAWAQPGDGGALEPEDGYYGRRRNPECVRGTATPEYRLKVADWRTPDPSLEPLRWVGPYRELRLRSVHRGRRTTMVPFDEAGAVTSRAAAEIADLFRSDGGVEAAPIDERLVRILYAISVHFDAPEVVIVSGYRTPESDGGRRSNHHHGRAVDIVVPGITNEAVAAYAREFGRVGVGLYPVSGFTHIDVRDRAFFWVDPSGPGEPLCTQAVLATVAREVDELHRPALEDPRRWAPVPMPPLPEDRGARPERPADRLDSIDDEAAVRGVFAVEIASERRAARRAVEDAERRRAERAERAERRAQTREDVRPERAASYESSNTTSPPATVATARPGASEPANGVLRPLETNDDGSIR